LAGASPPEGSALAAFGGRQLGGGGGWGKVRNQVTVTNVATRIAEQPTRRTSSKYGAGDFGTDYDPDGRAGSRRSMAYDMARVIETELKTELAGAGVGLSSSIGRGFLAALAFEFLDSGDRWFNSDESFGSALVRTLRIKQESKVLARLHLALACEVDEASGAVTHEPRCSLDGVKLTPSLRRVLAAWLCDNTVLQHLSVRSTAMDDDGVVLLAQSLTRGAPALTSLDLRKA
jgi:hypothetical protein